MRERLRCDVPTVFSQGQLPLDKYIDYINQCESSFKTIENYAIQNAFVYGMWLSRAFDRFQEEKNVKRVSGNFDNRIDIVKYIEMVLR